jgi:ankyrin repeat protein
VIFGLGSACTTGCRGREFGFIESVDTNNVNNFDAFGYSALHHAANEGHIVCVQLLVESGANVNCVNGDGATALYMASWCGHTECVQYLISAGADVNMCDNEGCSSLYIASCITLM